MIIRHDIKLRRELNSKNLYFNILNFMNKLNKGYIFIDKISYVKSSSVYSNIEEGIMLEKVLVNVKNKDEIRSIIREITSYINQNSLFLFAGDMIVIHYIRTIQSNYNKQIKNILNNQKRSYSTLTSSYNNEIYPVLDSINIKATLNKFLLENKDKLNNFIAIIVQIQNREYVYYTIGKRYPLDVTNPKAIEDYIGYLISTFDQLDKNLYDPALAEAIHINWINIDKDTFVLKTRQLELSVYSKEQKKTFDNSNIFIVLFK